MKPPPPAAGRKNDGHRHNGTTSWARIRGYRESPEDPDHGAFAATVVRRRLGSGDRRLCRKARYRGQGGSCGAAAGSRPGATDLLLRQGRRPGLVSSRPRNRDEGAGISRRESKKPRWPAGFRSLARSGWIYNERYARYV